jgi:hypothetical protein
MAFILGLIQIYQFYDIGVIFVYFLPIGFEYYFIKSLRYSNTVLYEEYYKEESRW